MPKVTEAHVEARRTQILLAACTCFASKGFHQTTVRDICKEAGLSAGAVYGYFKSKDEIIEALAELGRKNTRSLIEASLTHSEPLQALSELMTVMIGWLGSEESRLSVRLDVRMWGEGLHTPRIGELFRESYANNVEPIVTAVSRGQELSRIKSELDPDSTGRVLFAVCLGLIVQKALDPEVDLSGCQAVIAALLDGSFAQRGEER
jgi:AcrR family transcriptional regulator